MRLHRFSLLAIAALLFHSPSQASIVESEVLYDIARSRPVPIAVYRPADGSLCLRLGDCPVAFISPGYEGTADAYSFLAKALNEVGFLVIGVQHELSTDTPMPLGGDIQTVRSPYWRQGAASLAFLLSELPKTYGGFNWKNVVLIGHSNGGDISALFAKEHPRRVAALVTLDNRRIALPRDPTPRTLTIRSSDQQADSGVIPTLDELAVSRTCIVPIVGAQHNDMHDGGPLDLRLKIQAVVVQFLQHAECRYE